MSIATYKGIIVGGQIQLEEDVHLPEQARVFVVVPDESLESSKTHRIASPRLASPEQIEDFAMDISSAADDPV